MSDNSKQTNNHDKVRQMKGGLEHSIRSNAIVCLILGFCCKTSKLFVVSAPKPGETRIESAEKDQTSNLWHES